MFICMRKGLYFGAEIAYFLVIQGGLIGAFVAKFFVTFFLATNRFDVGGRLLRAARSPVRRNEHVRDAGADAHAGPRVRVSVGRVRAGRDVRVARAERVQLDARTGSVKN